MEVQNISTWVLGGRANQQKLFDWLGVQLGYNRKEDWYIVTHEDILKNGGGTVLERYNGSPSAALKNIYPQHKWILERFKGKAKQLHRKNSERVHFLSTKSLSQTPSGFWDKKEHQIEFFGMASR